MSSTLTFISKKEKRDHLSGLIDIPSINPLKYDPNANYHRLDFLFHEEFGPGFVDRVISSESIMVFFDHGVEELEHNRLSKIA